MSKTAVAVGTVALAMTVSTLLFAFIAISGDLQGATFEATLAREPPDLLRRPHWM